jgi:hypothetical protein
VLVFSETAFEKALKTALVLILSKTKRLSRHRKTKHMFCFSVPICQTVKVWQRK